MTMLCICNAPLRVLDTEATADGTTVHRLRTCTAKCGLMFMSEEKRVLLPKGSKKYIRMRDKQKTR